MRLEDRVVLVTGAGGGIGGACLDAFAREGARLVATDAPGAGLEAAEARLAALGCDGVALGADVSVPSQVEATVAAGVARFGRLDAVVACAGIGGRSLGDGPVDACTVEAWDRVMAVNLRGTFLTCKYSVPPLLESRGALVTIASVLGLVGTQGLFDTHAYAASKAGIVGLTRAIAAHYAARGLRANVVAPGLVDTRMARRTRQDPELLRQVAMWQPLGPLGEPSDVAAAALYLASDEARFVTGHVLTVDGGWTAQ